MGDFLNWELTNRMHNLGYDGKTLMYIDDEEDIINDDSAELIGAKPAILTSAAFRWFREKYNLYHVITIADLGKYESGNPDFQCAIYSKDPVVITKMDNYKSYEEAELACLDKLIKIVESKVKK